MTSFVATTPRRLEARGRRGRRVLHLGRALSFVFVLLNSGIVQAETVPLPWVEEQARKAGGDPAAQAARRDRARAEQRLSESRYGLQLNGRAGLNLAPGSELVEIPASDGGRVFVAGARQFGQNGALEPIARYEAGGQGEYLLFNFGRRALEHRAQRAEQEALVWGDAAESEARVRSARAAYVDWLGSSEVNRLAAQSLKRLVKLRERLEALVAEGPRPPGDALQALRSEQQSALEAQRARSAVTTARYQLAALLPTPLPQAAEPDTRLLTGDAASPAASTAPTDQSAERALIAERDGALARARRAARDRAPLVTLNAQAGWRAQGSRNFPVYSAGITATVPLLDGGANSARTAAQEARVAELDAKLSRQKLERERTRSLLREQLAAADEEAQLALALCGTAEQLLSRTQAAYELGEVTAEATTESALALTRAELEQLHSAVQRLHLQLECAALGCTQLAAGATGGSGTAASNTASGTSKTLP
jgi:outer membrane protein TolC